MSAAKQSRAPALALLLVLAATPLAAHASLLSPEMEDKVANFISWFVLIVLPPVGIAIFWMVHILPEKAAEKRHHPQKEGITVLCLLSLVFGGLLWPFAWLWAYTKPIAYKGAYGTDKHDDYFSHESERLHGASTDDIQVQADMRLLRDELDTMARKHPLSPELEAVRAKLDASLAASDAAVAGNAQGGAA
ncbi:DUF3302 domain-containing protein [Niveibacterium sp. SC-1]|uniref:DUF3302 domain-containing protein n=1 Tax=Niveibacterium sp. SC-1 TaxID=3135646 RepID=UPI00311F3638